MHLNIQNLETQHAESLSSLHRACFPKDWGIDEFLNILANERYSSQGVFVSNRLIAAISSVYIEAQADLVTFMVEPGAQSRGLGCALLSQHLHKLQSLKVNEVFLEVAVNNLCGIHIYKKLGFCVESIRKGYYSSVQEPCDAIIMRKTLGDSSHQ